MSSIDLTVSGSADSIIMVEGGALEVSENDILDGLKVAHKGIKELVGHVKGDGEEGSEAQDRVDQAAVDETLTKRVRDLGGEGHGQGHQRQGQGGPGPEPRHDQA
jgi:polyribonucleotide nucleotidyltransferase